jgi:class 3 adenylate cyclase/CHASE2 domain-containing sensor protein
MELQRKLAAILSADVKGYSRLMGDDEEATVRTITAYRQVMGALIRDHRGRVVDSPGDNLMAEFASAVDAIMCATEIQTALAAKNAELPEHRRMMFRIGINIGDVIVEGEEIYGDGVNIAARLESLADAGGICISGTVYDQVQRKLELGYDFMGEQQVKNITGPVRAYRVLWREEDLHQWGRTGIKLPHAPPLRKGVKNPWVKRIIMTSLLMIVLMPLANHLKLNVLTKIWQCRLTLLPNSMDVTVVTMEEDENMKMHMADGEKPPPSFTKDPKLWRKYHSRAIQNLYEMGAAAVGFDFWFSPPYDDATRVASQEFIRGLEWAKQKKLPIIVGQFQNIQDPEIYSRAYWGYISVYRDITWIHEVMYLLSWDRLDLSGVRVEKPSFFVQALARKIGLNPKIENGDVRLIGKSIPGRLWLAFSKTPFDKIPYHEVYNGTADKSKLANRIVLIGLCLTDTDYFRVPYSPTDFTPNDPSDSYGMPGVFLFANAINQIVNGYFHTEINDEWSWAKDAQWFSALHLESLLFLLLETISTCLLLTLVYVLADRRGSWKLTYSAMGLASIFLIMGLAFTHALFGLANFLFASILFMITCTRIKPVESRGVGNA